MWHSFLGNQCRADVQAVVLEMIDVVRSNEIKELADAMVPQALQNMTSRNGKGRVICTLKALLRKKQKGHSVTTVMAQVVRIQRRTEMKNRKE